MRRAAACCVLIAYVVCFSFVGCSPSGKDNGRELIATDTRQELQNPDRDRRKLSEELRQLRDEVDTKIKTISAELGNVKAPARASLPQQQETLTGCRSILEKTIDEVEKASSDSWTEVRTDARKTADSIRQVLENIPDE